MSEKPESEEFEDEDDDPVQGDEESLDVDRLTGLCASGRGYGPASEFQQVLAQLSREPARGFLGREASA